MFGWGHLSLALRDRMQGRWRRSDPVAWSPLSKPLSDCTLALVCSNAYMTEAGHRAGPGEHECCFRTISADTHRDEPAAHPLGGVDFARIEAERLMSVLDRARRLVESGRLGRLSPRHLSLSGAVADPSLLIEETKSTAVHQLADDHVDVVVLVPT
jgi:hypothetical protein